MIELTPSQINYLYVISTLDEPTVTGVAKKLGFSKPSIINAFNVLGNLGLLIYDKKNIKLTTKGKIYASNYKARKDATVLFLTNLLKVEQEQAEIDAEKIMQVVSCKTTVALHKFLKSELGIELPAMKDICLGECSIKK